MSATGWEGRSAAYGLALVAAARERVPAPADHETDGRADWPVPLRRHCQSCTDGEHVRCERSVYCSPWWPCVPCECECGDTLRRIRERQRAGARAAGHRGGEKVVAMLGVEHLRAAARLGGLATRRAMRGDEEEETA